MATSMPWLHGFRIYWRPRAHGELEPARYDPRIPVAVNLENHLELSREELGLSLEHLIGRPVFFEHMDNHEDYEPLTFMSKTLGLKRESWGFVAYSEQDPVNGSVIVYVQAHDSTAGHAMEGSLQSKDGPTESSLQHTRDIVRNRVAMNEVSSCARGKRPLTLYLGKHWFSPEELPVLKRRVTPTTSSSVCPSDMVDLSSLPYVNKGDFQNFLPSGMKFRTLQELHTGVTSKCSLSGNSFSPLRSVFNSPKNLSPLSSLSSLLASPFILAKMSVNAKASETRVDASTSAQKESKQEITKEEPVLDTVMVPASEEVPAEEGSAREEEPAATEEVVPRNVQEEGARVYSMLAELIKGPENLEKARASVQNLIHQLQLTNGVRAAVDLENKKKLSAEIESLKKSVAAYEAKEKDRRNKQTASFYKDVHAFLTHALPPERQKEIDQIFTQCEVADRASMLAPFMRIASTQFTNSAETNSKPVPTVMAKASLKKTSPAQQKREAPRPNKRARLSGAWEGVNFQFQ